MPLFFFDIEMANGEPAVDEQGATLENRDLARAFAEGIASTFQGDASGDPRRVIVKDDVGRVIDRVPADKA